MTFEFSYEYIAAKIYPAIKDNELTSVFRIGAELKDRIKAKPFMEAVQALGKRFPYYKVKLKAGFFWYYLEPENLPIATEPDIDTPCRAFDKNELMFRVLAKEKNISVEFSHILTDGTGAFEFLKTLLLTYFEKCHVGISTTVPFLQPDETAKEEEYEDAYNRYFKKIEANPPRIPRAFHVPFPLNDRSRLDRLTAIVRAWRIVSSTRLYCEACFAQFYFFVFSSLHKLTLCPV